MILRALVFVAGWNLAIGGLWNRLWGSEASGGAESSESETAITTETEKQNKPKHVDDTDDDIQLYYAGSDVQAD